jgi:hypothetical protein
MSWVGQARGSTRRHGNDARDEGLEVEGLLIKYPLGFGVGRVMQLEAAIQQQPVDLIRADAPANVIGGLENGDV